MRRRPPETRARRRSSSPGPRACRCRFGRGSIDGLIKRGPNERHRCDRYQHKHPPTTSHVFQQIYHLWLHSTSKLSTRRDASEPGTSMSGFQSLPPAPSAFGEGAKEISKTLLYAGRVLAAYEPEPKPAASRRTIELLAARRPAPDERTPSSWRACGIVPHDVGARRQISPVRRRDASRPKAL